ncbi:putative transcriptional regulatory protein [Yarrowia sp. C11]|nr:putative transcriptional regulatory protein [Yarrowia sp. C11]KAG5363998.1 putative transcriptional regulatory protein [Yarrowia sp. E02]
MTSLPSLSVLNLPEPVMTVSQQQKQPGSHTHHSHLTYTHLPAPVGGSLAQYSFDKTQVAPVVQAAPQPAPQHVTQPPQHVTQHPAHNPQHHAHNPQHTHAHNPQPVQTQPVQTHHTHQAQTSSPYGHPSHMTSHMAGIPAQAVHSTHVTSHVTSHVSAHVPYSTPPTPTPDMPSPALDSPSNSPPLLTQPQPMVAAYPTSAPHNLLTPLYTPEASRRNSTEKEYFGVSNMPQMHLQQHIQQQLQQQQMHQQQQQQQYYPHGYRQASLSPPQHYHWDSQPQMMGLAPSHELKQKMHKRQVRKRTKTGCMTCRKRRIKCDEAKPSCFNCAKSKRDCMGYC